MGRSPCCEKVGLKKGPWTSEEDQKLLAYIEQHGHGSWRALPTKAGLQRCGKSCRLRWTNYLRPDIKRGKFSLQEEQTIIQLHALLGNRWSAIATHLPKRTDNEIKNYWNTHIKKRLTKMGIDPMTHKPKTDALSSGTTNLSHMAQWESARLQAEARLVRESKLFVFNSNPYQPEISSSLPAQLPNKATTPPLCLDVLKAWQARFGFFSPTGSLESPTSILNFSDSIVPPTTVGLAGNPTPVMADQNSGEAAKQTMDDMAYPNEAPTCTVDSLKLPSFMEGFTDILEFEENKNYWNSVLNLVNSSDSPVF
ncbi:hypothetical protein LguiB_024940 [Lonicera macranthoides]